MVSPSCGSQIYVFGKHLRPSLRQCLYVCAHHVTCCIQFSDPRMHDFNSTIMFFFFLCLIVCNAAGFTPRFAGSVSFSLTLSQSLSLSLSFFLSSFFLLFLLSFFSFFLSFVRSFLLYVSCVMTCMLLSATSHSHAASCTFMPGC